MGGRGGSYAENEVRTGFNRKQGEQTAAANKRPAKEAKRHRILTPTHKNLAPIPAAPKAATRVAVTAKHGQYVQINPEHKPLTGSAVPLEVADVGGFEVRE